MNKLVWVFGLLLALSFVFPDGLPAKWTKPTPEVPVVVVPDVPVDAKIVEILAKADPADKARVDSVYTGLARVLKRDGVKGKRLATTEQWAELHSNTLDLAIETPGKYPGLDAAIDAVFLAQVGTDDVMPANDATRQKLIAASDIVAASAKK